jgi:hypothetical protein
MRREYEPIHHVFFLNFYFMLIEFQSLKFLLDLIVLILIFHLQVKQPELNNSSLTYRFLKISKMFAFILYIKFISPVHVMSLP